MPEIPKSLYLIDFRGKRVPNIESLFWCLLWEAPLQPVETTWSEMRVKPQLSERTEAGNK
jgi:hypothetical protein